MRLLLLFALLALAGCGGGGKTTAPPTAGTVSFTGWGAVTQDGSGNWWVAGSCSNSGSATAYGVRWSCDGRGGSVTPDALVPGSSGGWSQPAVPNGGGGYTSPGTTPTFTWSN